MVSVNSTRVAASIECNEQTAIIYLDDLTLTPGDKLRLEFPAAQA